VPLTFPLEKDVPKRLSEDRKKPTCPLLPFRYFSGKPAHSLGWEFDAEMTLSFLFLSRFFRNCLLSPNSVCERSPRTPSFLKFGAPAWSTRQRCQRFSFFPSTDACHQLFLVVPSTTACRAPFLFPLERGKISKSHRKRCAAHSMGTNPPPLFPVRRRSYTSSSPMMISFRAGHPFHPSSP